MRPHGASTPMLHCGGGVDKEKWMRIISLCSKRNSVDVWAIQENLDFGQDGDATGQAR